MEPPPQAKSTIDYQHLYLVDSFYDTDGNDRNKTRVTRNEKTGEVVECIQKRKLGDLNIYSPKRAADWRVSVNVEVPGMLPEQLSRSINSSDDSLTLSV
jgi:polynucleotide 5'-triphosphatase